MLKIDHDELEIARAIVTLRRNKESRTDADETVQKAFAVIDAILSEAARKHNCPVCGASQILYVTLTKEL
jgi:predicted RNA-binding Zn-ribbon protein involved in translation (DUF1610 family)